MERVLILGDEPVMTRPIPAALVLEALPKACKVDRPLCESVRHYLDRYMQTTGVEFTSVSAAATSGSSNTVLPNQHGEKAQSPYEVAGAGLPAAELLHAAECRRCRLPGPCHAHRDDAQPRFRLGAARHRLARPLVVADDRQLDADQHRSADHALDHAVELPAADAPRAAVRGLRRPDVGVGSHRAAAHGADPECSPGAIPRSAASASASSR